MTMMVSEKDALERVSGLTQVRLRTWISRGWIAPAQGQAGYVYSEIDIVRCDLIRQLRDEMEIDRETVPVVLSLLDQVYGLRRELRTVMRAIERQPEDVRRQILDALE
jgi:chaperone modulatory protein CbpM